MKIFQIGFNKCGTSSLHERFLALGLKSIHHDDGKLALRMKENIENGDNVIAGYRDYDAFTDLVHLSWSRHVQAFKYYKKILLEVPEAVFIYNIRNKQKWLRSCKNHENYLDRIKKVYNYRTLGDALDHLSRDWDRHFEEVQRNIPPERLLVFNIETDDARKIDRFLGYPDELPKTLMHANFTDGWLLKILQRSVPTPLQMAVPTPARRRLRYVLRARR
jgi:hypothetical protein